MERYKSIIKTVYRSAKRMLIKLSGKDAHSRDSPAVKKALAGLNPGADIEELYEDYIVDKICKCLIILGLGVAFATAAHINAKVNDPVKKGIVKRDDYLGSDIEIKLIDEYGDRVSVFDTRVYPRMLSDEECEIRYSEFEKQLDRLLLKNNEDPDHISSDLGTVTGINGYPFEISWECDKPAILSTDSGTISMVDEEVDITLDATVRYFDKEWNKSYHLTVVPKALDEYELRERDIAKLLSDSEMGSRDQNEWVIPTDYKGEELRLGHKTDDSGPVIAGICVIVAIVVFFMTDKDLQSKVNVRREQIRKSYPEIVRKFALYLGAGMTVRKAFEKLSSEEEELPVYSEISYTVHELRSGMAESECYERFGRRIGLQEYIRLGTLLVQNLKKGSVSLKDRLREEADNACRDQMQECRRKGEEAVTKLLVPMVMMLLVVMVMVMFPAFTGMGI